MEGWKDGMLEEWNDGMLEEWNTICFQAILPFPCMCFL